MADTSLIAIPIIIGLFTLASLAYSIYICCRGCNKVQPQIQTQFIGDSNISQSEQWTTDVSSIGFPRRSQRVANAFELMISRHASEIGEELVERGADVRERRPSDAATSNPGSKRVLIEPRNNLGRQNAIELNDVVISRNRDRANQSASANSSILPMILNNRRNQSVTFGQL